MDLNNKEKHEDNVFQNEIHQAVEQIKGDLVEMRRHLHMHPELSHNESETVVYIQKKLEKLGLTPFSYTGKDVIAYIEGSQPGPTVALRADIDALPIQEETGLPFASKVAGVMHACGHDGHTAILLGSADALTRIKTKFAGRVKLIFQHAEEVCPGGAAELVRAGALEDVDAIFGLHLWQNVELGQLATCRGPIMAGADSFTIRIQGTGGHGSMPHLSVDPIVVAAQLVLQLQTIVSRSINPLYPAVVSVGQIHAGDTYNIIPDTALIEGTVRYFHPEIQQEIAQVMERMINQTCAAYGAKGELEYVVGDPSVINDAGMNEIVEQVGRQVLGNENVRTAEASMAGEDFSYYLQQIPGAYFFLGIRGDIAKYSHHHPCFTIDEQMLPIGSKLLAGIAVHYLTALENTVK